MTTFSAGFIVLIVVSLICTCKGLVDYTWFSTAGFGYAMAGIGLYDLVMFKGSHGIGSFLICVLLIAFGFRQGMLLKGKTNKINDNKDNIDIKEVELSKSITAWITYSVFYVFVASPVFYRLHNDMGKGILAYFGVAIMALGFAIEIMAIKQRKENESTAFCRDGLYAKMRLPVCFGDMLFWTGIFLSGAPTIRRVGQAVVVLIGYLGIMYFYIRHAKKLELELDNKFDRETTYLEYIKKTPILVPFVKVYSLQECTWIDDVEEKINAIFSKLEIAIKPIAAKLDKKKKEKYSGKK